MSFISSLFGGGGSAPTPITPAPIPATPTISSGQVEATDREQASRRRGAGMDSTILTKGLGDTGSTGSGQAAQVTKSTALGGNSPLS